MGERETSRWADYQARLDRVIDYIHDHPHEDLNLNRLAEVACLSPYHWHRVYHGMLGETAAATVRRVRLHRAAGDLVGTEGRVRDIAAAHGFGSVQAFSRVFRAAFGLSPGAYRARGKTTNLTLERKDWTYPMYEIEIRDIPAGQALTCAHTGSYMTVSRAFDHLCGWLAAHGAMGEETRLIGIFYDDPAAVPEEKLRSRAGAILAPGVELESPFDRTEVRGGEYAVLRHRGSYAELPRAYQWLYGQWLPQSGREGADAPTFEEYLNSPLDTAPPDLLTDICLPLR